MTTKNADTLKREREALRDATARKIEALVPGFDIDLFRDQLVVHAIPGTGCRSIDVRFGSVDLDRPGEFGVRVNVPATGSFDPTDRADGTTRMCLALAAVMDNAAALEGTLREYDEAAKRLAADGEERAVLHVARGRNDFGYSIGTAEAGGKTYRVQVKWFDEPSRFGIRNGRVSKLFVAGVGEGTVADYNRGWDVRPRNAAARAILKAVLEEFN